MKIKTGSFAYQDYAKLISEDLIFNNNNKMFENQIQPSSLDLTLSEECYEITASFLNSSNQVRENLKHVMISKIDLTLKFKFKKNKIYLVRLNEKLKLNKNIFGICNPKSSTGRLDIFCRTILDYTNEYEKIPYGYRGELFIEISSNSFDIEFQKGDSLNQMRLIYSDRIFVKDEKLRNFHSRNFLTLDKYNKKIKPHINNGLKISVDLSNKNKINGYSAKNRAPKINFRKIKFHKIEKYWDKVLLKNGKLLIEKNKFYILKSKEKIHIPKNMAGEMIPYDTSLGDYRVHYAGFFDPGFGSKVGSFAVLEVKTNEVPFFLEDGQSIARIKYEMLNKDSKLLYGENINSNYQNQDLALSKHFI